MRSQIRQGRSEAIIEPSGNLVQPEGKLFIAALIRYVQCSDKY